MKRMIAAVCVLSMSLVAACGWQLRGTASMPAAVAQIKLDTQKLNAQMVVTLRNALNGADVQIDRDAHFTLQVSEFRQESRNVSIDRAARSAQRELSFEVTAQLLADDGDPVFGPETISASRIYRDDPDNVVAKVNEERLIENELQEGLSRQILSWLRAAGLSLNNGHQPAAAANEN